MSRWDALGGLGAGGAAEPYAVSAANAIVYGVSFTYPLLPRKNSN